MENFVFPDAMKTKLKMYDFMNIFPILTGIPQKSSNMSFFIFTEQTVKKDLYILNWCGEANALIEKSST